MYGCGESDRLIVAEKRLNKGCGAPQSAESVEPSGLTKGNSFLQNKFRTQCREGLIWKTLNGHEARNRGYSQETVPTSSLWTCKVSWSGYGRLPAGIRSYGSHRSGTTCATSIDFDRPTSASSGMPHRESMD